MWPDKYDDNNKYTVDKNIYDKYNKISNIEEMMKKYVKDEYIIQPLSPAEQIEAKRQETIKVLKQLDISDQLSDDARAKLIMLNGDFVIIPLDKIK